MAIGITSKDGKSFAATLCVDKMVVSAVDSQRVLMYMRDVNDKHHYIGDLWLDALDRERVHQDMLEDMLSKAVAESEVRDDK